MSNKKEISSFMTDIRIALIMRPLEDPNKVCRMTCQAMMFHRIYTGTDCERHVTAGHSHALAYEILKPAIELHRKMVGV